MRYRSKFIIATAVPWAVLVTIVVGCVLGCTIHLVTIQVRAKSNVATTQPAESKSFTERLLEDVQ